MIANIQKDWPAYAAALWAFAFALMSFYWAAGGLVGVDTLGTGMKQLAEARDPELITVTWITGILKVIAGLLVLSLIPRWAGYRLRRLAVYAAGIVLSLYGLASFAEHLLMLTGSRAIPDLLGTTDAVRWHLLWWDPFWFAGGVLFILAARKSQPELKGAS